VLKVSKNDIALLGEMLMQFRGTLKDKAHHGLEQLRHPQ
jgi:hypothetical protein